MSRSRQTFRSIAPALALLAPSLACSPSAAAAPPQPDPDTAIAVTSSEGPRVGVDAPAGAGRARPPLSIYSIYRLAPIDPLPRVPDELPLGFEPTTANPLADARGYVILGVASLPTHRGADEQARSPFLISRFGLGPLELSLEGLDWYADVLPSPVWRAGATIGFELGREDSRDGASSALARDGGADAPAAGGEGDIGGKAPITGASELGFGAAPGVFAGFELPSELLPEGLVSARVSLRAASGERDGHALTLDADYFFAATFMWRLGIAAKVELADARWVDSRYGLDRTRADALGVAGFEAAGGVHALGASVYSIVSLSPTLGLFTRVARTRLQGDAARSPLVHDARESFSGVGVFYLF